MKKNNDLIAPLICILFAIAFGFLIGYLYCRPSNDVLPTTPTKEIVQQTEDKVQPVENKIDSLTKVYEKSRDSLTVLKFKWQAAVAENKRLREMRAPSHRMHVDFLPKFDNMAFVRNGIYIDSSANPVTLGDSVIYTNGTAEDYITETQTAAQIADSLCAETIGAMERRGAITDSLYQSQKTIAEIFRQGFNNLAQQSQLKDAAIKSLNKQLKWQKVQATGLKVAAIAIAAVVIKNNIK